MNVAQRRTRVAVVQVVVLALMAALFVRLWFLQVLSSDAYARAATDNTVREVLSPAPRGLILDVMGRPLVRNRTSMVVSVDRGELARQPDRGEGVLDRLAEVLDTSADDLRARLRPCGGGVSAPCWNGSRYTAVPVASDVDPAVALEITERREAFPGVAAEQVAAREYPAPRGANAAHVLGYLQPANAEEAAAQRAAGRADAGLLHEDLVGRAGLEKQYDDLLRGTPGSTRLAVDRLGRVIGPVGETPARPGHSLVTTLDANIQAVAEKQLQAAIERARTQPDFRGRTYKADSGAVVVLDVNTGGIVAMASAPSYDPGAWVGGISSQAYKELTSKKAGIPLLARAFAGGGSAPGSTFKPISTAAAAMAGWSLEDRYPCPSSVTIGDRDFGNFESESYGPITLARALEVSCDTVFYGIAHDMWLRDGGITPVEHPKDPIQAMARAFGLGAPSGLDLPGESAGRILDRERRRADWEATKKTVCKHAKKGYPKVKDAARAAYLKQLAVENCADGYAFRAGDAVNASIGQGETLVTPLQMARVYAAIANGGRLVRPHVAKAELTPEGRLVSTLEPADDGRVPVSDEVLHYLKDALIGVTERGTAAGVYAGWPHERWAVAAKTGTAEKFGLDPTSWFASFVPAGKPRYAVVMTVSQGGTGSGTSGPSVREIEEALLGVDGRPLVPEGRAPLPLPVALADGTFAKPERDPDGVAPRPDRTVVGP